MVPSSPWNAPQRFRSVASSWRRGAAAGVLALGTGSISFSHPQSADPVPPPTPSESPTPNESPTPSGPPTGTAPNLESDPRSAAPTDAGTSAETGGDATPSRRVYLWVDRYEEIGGTVIEEDDSLLSIMTPNEDIRTFSKSRIMRIIPLLDVESPGPGMVQLRDGSVLRGTLIEDDFDVVLMRIEGVFTRFPRESVVQVFMDLPLEAKYARARNSIEPDQYRRRFDLANWLFEEGAYDLAQSELRDIVEKSQLPAAIRLLRIVDAQIELEQGSIRRETEGAGPDFEPRRIPLHLQSILPDEHLAADDVNLIRVYEIDFRNPPSQIFIAPESIRELLEKYGASPLIPNDSTGRTQLFRADPIDLVDLMFKLKARDLYSRIEVKSEPPALNIFRQRVHDAWLIPNCATSQCHGGLDGGRFFLHRRNAKSARVRYTNLLILERWDELPYPLVDWDNPANSLLVQYALPRAEARFPHPEVPGWKPVFKPGNQRLLRDSLRWIESMYRPRPGYPIEFEPPVIAVPELPEPLSPQDEPTDRQGR